MRMDLLRPLAWLAAWSLPAAGAAAPPALQGYRPVPDALWPADRGLGIEWKDTWEATRKHNLRRWDQQLRQAERDRSRLGRRLCYRQYRLLEALAKRFPQARAECRAARRAMPDLVARMGFSGRANYLRKQLIEESPGDFALAVERLGEILATALEARATLPERAAWTHYASTRLLALHRSGRLSSAHPAAVLALKGWAASSAGRGDLLEAARAVDALADRPDMELWAGTRRARLLERAGRTTDALALWETLDARFDALATRKAVAALRRQAVAAPPMFPRPMGLEMRWEGLRRHRPEEQTEALAELIASAASSWGLTQVGGGLHGSVWWAVDRHLRSQGRSALGSLRKANESSAAEALRSVPAGGAEEVLAAFRRYPWASSAHEALIRAADRALREGRPGWAVRAFGDVLSHSPDAEALGRARAGLWLALAQDGRNRPALEREARSAGSMAALPWMGRRVPAGELAKRLLVALPAAPPAGGGPAAAGLPVTVLEFEAASPWPAGALDRLPDALVSGLGVSAGELQAAGGSILLSGPAVLACYDVGSRRPRWIHRRELHCGQVRPPRARAAAAPGHFRPTVAGGRVYSRWGWDPRREQPACLVALDLKDGAMLWSTSGDPAWAGLLPVGDPTVAEGRVYVAAMPGGDFVPACLVCLDAETGAVLWKRLLGTQNAAIEVARALSFDPARYGSPVTVRDGCAYVSTNLGHVAKLDARDGLALWVRPYDRAGVDGGNVHRIARRLGSAPIVADEAVVLLPRDCAGAFALDQQTGNRLWDNPFVPSDEAVGLFGRTLVLTDEQNVVGLDVSDGKVRWRVHLDAPLAGSARRVGACVWAAAGGRIVRIAAATGRVLDEQVWPEAEPARQIVVCGQGLAAVTARSARPGPAAARAGKAPASPGDAALPARPIWALRRAEPRMLVPPAGVGADGAVLLASGDVLERVDASTGRVRWQRAVACGFQDAAWTSGAVVMIHDRRAVAVDLADGRQLWEVRWPFEATYWRRLGEKLFVGRHPRGRWAGLIDLAGGKLLWAHYLNEVGYYYTIADAGWDGRNVHVLCLPHGGSRPRLLDFTCRAADGHILAVRQWPRPRRLAVAGGRAFTLGDGNRLELLSWAGGGKPLRFDAELTGQRLGGLVGVDVAGDWVGVRFHYGYRANIWRTWVLKLSDPAYSLFRRANIEVRGGNWFIRGNQRVKLVDPATDREVTCRGGRDSDEIGWQHPLELWTAAGVACVVSENKTTRTGRNSRPISIQVDAFDRQTGRRLGTEVLPGVSLWTEAGQQPRTRTQVARRGGLLLATDADGLHAFGPGGPERPRPVRLAYRAPAPPRLDGDLAEWDASERFRLEGAEPAELMLSHDDDNLYLAVRHRTQAARAQSGRGEFAAGCQLEVGLTYEANRWRKGTFRWGCGTDRTGRFVAAGFAGGKVPDGLTGAARHDVAAGEVIYELAIPKRLAKEHVLPRDFGLSAAVWADGRAAEFGPALRGRRADPRLYERVRLGPMTRRAEQAALALADRTADLDYSFLLWRRSAALRAASDEDLRSACADYLRRHPRSRNAGEVLAMLHLHAGPDASASPVEGICALARKAGVAEPTVAAYRRLAGNHLSVWVHVAKRPAVLGVQVHAAHASGYVAWGETLGGLPPRRSTAAVTRRGGEMPPAGRWVELRAGLMALDMHDRPIISLTLVQSGGRVTWDRLALVAGGKETVLIDDDLGESTGRAGWKWVDQPTHSGSKAVLIASGISPSSGRLAVKRLTARRKRPLTAHLPPPPAPPGDSEVKALVKALTAGIPALGPNPAAYRFFRELLRLESPQPARRAELCEWFVGRFPEHPRAVDLLTEALRAREEAGQKDAAGAVEAAIARAGLPRWTAYAYRRQAFRTARARVLTWQTLGPFAPTASAVYPPDAEGIVLTRTYRGAGGGQIGWRERTRTTGRTYNHIEPAGLRGAKPPDAVGYAGCWVYLPKAGAVVMEHSFGHSGRITVNGRLAASGTRRQGRTLVQMPAGWSQLLVRTRKGLLGGYFVLEIVDPAGRGAPPGIRFSTTPPAAR